jgi:D-alanyl-D-alanine dipeptidase
LRIADYSTLMKKGAPEPIAALNRINILETGEPLVDIRDACPGVLVREEVCPFLRATVAEMLNRAQSALPAGYKFKVGTALRTLSMQRKGWDGYFAQMRAAHPEWPLSALRRATNRFHAPYDQSAPPGHCTGGAVDVVLLGPDCEPVDVTSPLEGWGAAYTWSDRLHEESRRNRMLIVDAMLGAGFSNCREEYWHYSWGDSAWAVRVGETTCPYGCVTAPPVVEARHTGALAREIRRLGDAAWACSAHEGDIDVAVLWHEGREVQVRIEDHHGDELFSSSDRKEWAAISADRGDGALTVRLAPQAPRVYLRSRPLEESS